jgi:hypothetical protein
MIISEKIRAKIKSNAKIEVILLNACNQWPILNLRSWHEDSADLKEAKQENWMKSRFLVKIYSY